MAYSAGTATAQKAQKSVRDEAKWKDGDEYIRYKIESTTAGQWVGEIWVLKSTVVSEGAAPATITLA